MDTYFTIKKTLDKLHRFPDEQVAIFYSMVAEKLYSKNAVVLRPGKVCDFIAIVLSGSLRLYKEAAVVWNLHYKRDFSLPSQSADRTALFAV